MESVRLTLRASSRKIAVSGGCAAGVQHPGPEQCRAWWGIFRVCTSGNGYPSGILPVAEGKYAARSRWN